MSKCYSPSKWWQEALGELAFPSTVQMVLVESYVVTVLVPVVEVMVMVSVVVVASWNQDQPFATIILHVQRLTDGSCRNDSHDGRSHRVRDGRRACAMSGQFEPAIDGGGLTSGRGSGSNRERDDIGRSSRRSCGARSQGKFGRAKRFGRWIVGEGEEESIRCLVADTTCCRYSCDGDNREAQSRQGQVHHGEAVGWWVRGM